MGHAVTAAGSPGADGFEPASSTLEARVVPLTGWRFVPAALTYLAVMVAVLDFDDWPPVTAVVIDRRSGATVVHGSMWDSRADAELQAAEWRSELERVTAEAFLDLWAP